MLNYWLKMFFLYSGKVYSVKKKILETQTFYKTILITIWLLILEIGLFIFALPLFLIVSPKNLQERGFVFPFKEKEVEHKKYYSFRRKISVLSFFGIAGIIILKVMLVFTFSFYFSVQTLLASSQNWTFDLSGDYVHNNNKIEFVSGIASLKAINSTVSGTNSNTSFSTSSVGWTYASWVHDVNGSNSGNYQSTGGNTGGYININLSVRRNKTEAGYWSQPFIVSVNYPDTATLNLDWRNVSFGNTPKTYRLYAFIESTSGVPGATSTAVWNSGEITGTTTWTSVINVDIKSKLSTSGTYYLKIGAYATRPNTAPNNSTYISGFDNVLINWSKNVSSYSTDKPDIYPVESLSTSHVLIWNSFVESAVKNGGQIYYQLSDDDGVSWKYWNNSSWTTATLANHYNTSSVVNSNIHLFSTSTNKIKWKAFLESNGSQKVSLDTITIDYTENFSPIITNLSYVQSSSTGNVDISYFLQDQESDSINLSVFEYSLDEINWFTMTPSTTDPLHEGISNLVSSPSGVSHKFIWNCMVDLGEVFTTNTYIRLKGDDGISQSNLITSSVFSIDNNKPTISVLSAEQSTSTREVEIHYDLVDHNTSSLFVNLEISANNGITWDISSSSLTGDIGNVVGVGVKNIKWQIENDYLGQEKDTMLIRLKAKDIFNNQSEFSNSAPFIIDTRYPETSSTADLLAQPIAGDSSVLIGGSFVEGNPFENYFLVMLGGESYGNTTTGDKYTAIPTDKIVDAGRILKGNDYVASVKIVHVDQYGHSSVNENNNPNYLYKYVKPFTPNAPSLANAGLNTVELTINKHPDETDGLEYAILENTYSKYIQSDGTLGDTPVWRTIGTDIGKWGEISGVPGMILVNGLENPVSDYSFKTKSRNSSDTLNNSNSESEFSSGVSTNYNSPNIILNFVTSTKDGAKYVIINYTGIDYQERQNDLVKIEYSLDGVNWNTMTEKTGVESDGVSDLSFSSIGKEFIFAWDVFVDLGGIEDTSVFVRLQSNDTISDSNLAVSSVFEIDTIGPRINNILVVQKENEGNVEIKYDLEDEAGYDNNVEIYISSDGGVAYDVNTTTVSGNVGSNIFSGIERIVNWNAKIDFDNQENETMKVKIRAKDRFGNEGLFVESNIFYVDTKKPSIVLSSVGQLLGDTQVKIDYNLSEASSSVELQISSDSGLSWNVNTTTLEGDIKFVTTSGDKNIWWNAKIDFDNQESNSLKMKIKAVDFYGNQREYIESSDFSLDTAPPNGLSEFYQVTSTVNSITLQWSTGLVDANFDKYEIWHGFNQNETENRTGTANLWSVSEDSGLANISSNSSTITGIVLTDDYFVKIWAIDIYKNESTVTSSIVILPVTATTTPTTTIPENPTVSGSSGGSYFYELPIIETTTEEEVGLTTTEESIATSSLSTTTIFEPTPVIAPLVVKEEPENEQFELIFEKPTLLVPVREFISISKPVEEIVEFKETKKIVAPEVLEVDQSLIGVEGKLKFKGIALPNQEVAVYIHSEQAVVYRTQADVNGVWTVEHSQKYVELAPGQHSIFSVAIDKTTKEKSFPSTVKVFLVEKNMWAVIFNFLNFYSTLATTLFICLVVGWLIYIKNKRLEVFEKSKI